MFLHCSHSAQLHSVFNTLLVSGLLQMPVMINARAHHPQLLSLAFSLMKKHAQELFVTATGTKYPDESSPLHMCGMKGT